MTRRVEVLFNHNPRDYTPRERWIAIQLAGILRSGRLLVVAAPRSQRENSET